jgi:aminopeptidase N
VTVEVFVFPEHRAAGEAALEATVDAVMLYERLFKPYPHSSLSLVEGQFPDGMEYDGLFFLGQEYFAAYDGTPRNYLTALAVHETAHQWWYGLAGSDQALEPWLDEAWATYSELLFYEAVYPDLAGWWWDYRVNRFEPAGWVDSTIYDHRSFRPYVNAVYLRGAQFLQHLRDSLGDRAFLDLAHDLLASGTDSIVSTEQFLAIASEKAGGLERLPLDSFFHSEWLVLGHLQP